MNFIRENILKIFIIVFAFILFIVIISACSHQTVTVEEKYETMEQELSNATEKYANSNNTILPREIGSTRNIQMSTLIKNEQIKEMHANEDKNIVCDGYVSILKKSAKKYLYRPYLKCGKYYETKTIAQYILDNEKKVTENDGLYKTTDKYIYKGENPNNYVNLDGKIYRIISINNNKEVKLISTVPTDDSYTWDDRYNSEKDENYGINVFSKSRIKDSLKKVYESEFFSSKTREYIEPHDICVGKRGTNDADLTGTLECSVIEKNQYIGLIQTNEYLNASIDPNCKNSSNRECGNYNYFMSFASYIVSQNATTDNTYSTYAINDGTLEMRYCYNDFRIYPVIYFNKNVLYKSGSGTQTNPYIVR